MTGKQFVVFLFTMLIATTLGGCRENRPAERAARSVIMPVAPIARSEQILAPSVSANTPESAPPKPPPAPPREDMRSIAEIEGVVLDLRYRTSNNFIGEDLYGEYAGCYLHRDAAEKLEAAAAILRSERHGWKLRVLDALRPVSVQKRMYAKVKGTPAARYVADPREGSGHNYGMSIDVTLQDQAGREVDMGTQFDDFTPLAQPRHELANLKSGKLTQAQFDNRQLLRRIMKQAGFNVIQQEWWHFNARGMKTIKARYRIVGEIE